MSYPAYIPQNTWRKARVSGEIRGEGIRFEKEVSLYRGEVKEVVFTPEEFPQLVIRNPRLWGPLNKGPQELYDLKEMALLFSSSVSKSQKLERMAALRQNLPADYESCSMWRDVLYWREHAFSKLDTLSSQDDHQIVRGDVEWCGLRLIERFVAASNTVGVVRLANELLQRKWLSVSTVMLLESVMASQANSHAFAFDRELFSCANPWMLDPKDKALAFMALVDTKTGTDTQERRKEFLAL